MSESEVRALRLEKLERLKELGHNPYDFEEHPQTHSALQIREEYASLSGISVSFAGRVTSHRLMGKAAFFDLTKDGDRIQIYIKKDDVGELLWEVFGLVDLGDLVGVTGEVFTTKTGEISIHARELRVLSKCFHVLPL